MQTISFEANLAHKATKAHFFGHPAETHMAGVITMSGVSALMYDWVSQTEEKTGIYIPITIHGPSRTLSHQGALAGNRGGHDAYIVSAVANPKQITSINEWKIAVLGLMDLARKHYGNVIEVVFDDPNINGKDVYYLDSEHALKDCIDEINESNKEKEAGADDVLK